MFTFAQRTYLEEVLGTSTQHYRRPAPVVVLTPDLDGSEQALLEKILAAVNLKGYVQAAEIPAGVTPRHVLQFHASLTKGRVDTEGAPTRWIFPTVASMTGNAPEVGALKKEAWSLLQQFQSEVLK